MKTPERKDITDKAFTEYEPFSQRKIALTNPAEKAKLSGSIKARKSKHLQQLRSYYSTEEILAALEKEVQEQNITTDESKKILEIADEIIAEELKDFYTE